MGGTLHDQRNVPMTQDELVDLMVKAARSEIDAEIAVVEAMIRQLVKAADPGMPTDTAKAAWGDVAKWGDSWEDQERGGDGRFGSGSSSTTSGGGPQPHDIAGSGPQHAAGAGSPRPGMGDVKPNAGTIAAMREGSAGKYMDEHGNFTPERAALHDQIVKNALSGVQPSDNPTFKMMGGGSASGKSSMISSGKVDNTNMVTIDADHIKTQFPEFAQMKAAGDSTWAAHLHEESSYVASRIQAASFETRSEE